MFSEGIRACLAYGLNTAFLSILDKGLIVYFNFKSPLILLCFQYLLLICSIEFARKRGFSSLPKFSWKEAEACLPLTGCFLLSNILGLHGIAYVNLPMYIAIRNLDALVVFVLGLYIDKTVPKTLFTISIFCISAGALISGVNDLKSDGYGYVLLSLASLAKALQLFIAKHQKMHSKKLTAWTQPYYTALLSLPITYVLAVSSGEGLEFSSLYYSELPEFYLLLMCVVIIGVLSDFTMFQCAAKNSPMAVMITMKVKDLVVICIGIFGFWDVELNLYFVVGIFLNMAGAILYSYSKCVEKKTLSINP